MNNLVRCVIACLILCSCSKNDTPTPTPPGPAPVLPDTLTAGWTKVLINAADNYADIYFADNNLGYVGGDRLYKTTNGGLTWTKVGDNMNISNFSVTPDGKVIIVNGQDSVVRSADGGVSFSRSFLNAGPASDVFFTGNDTGYITGATSLMRTVNGGLTWAAVSAMTGYPLGGNYKGAFFLNAGLGWLTIDNKVFRTNGSAGNWMPTNFVTPPVTTAVSSVYAPDVNTVYAGFSSGIYKSTNGGSSFVKLPLDFTAVSQYFPDVHFIDRNTGYACYGRKLYKTTDGGNTWQTVVSLGESELVEIHFTDATHGWACGTKGTLLLFR